MAHIVAEPCVGCKFTDCVEVCPVNCFYEADDRLYIHPDECIDCTACVPVCSVAAIFAEGDRSPITLESIQLGVAISRQVSTAVNLWWCFERLSAARHDLTVTHDKVIKAERLVTLGEVTRAVEHEINNPLNVIMNWAEIYRGDEQVDPEIRKIFQIIFDMAMRIRSVIIKLTEVKDVKPIEFLKGKKMTDLG